MLREQQQIRSTSGGPPVVVDPRLTKAPQLSSFTQDALARGWHPTSRVLQAAEEPADVSVARDLGLAPGSPVAHLRRLRLADGAPMAFEEVWLPQELVPGLVDQDLHGSLYELLEERYDLVIFRHDRRISAITVDGVHAESLGPGRGGGALRDPDRDRSARSAPRAGPLPLPRRQVRLHHGHLRGPTCPRRRRREAHRRTHPGEEKGTGMRRRTVLAGLALSGLTAAGCSSGGSGGGGGGGDVDISDTEMEASIEFAAWESDFDWDAVIAGFNEKCPNITVQITKSPFKDFFTRLQTQASGDNLPDAFMMNGPNFQLYASNDIIVPFDKAVEDGDLDFSNYPEAMEELYTYEGTPYAVPTSYDSIGLWYNEDLFERPASRSPPASGPGRISTRPQEITRRQDEIVYGLPQRVQPAVRLIFRPAAPC